MAKVKKPIGPQKPAPVTTPPLEQGRDRLSLAQWAIINAVFVLFCVIQYWLVYLLFNKETLGMPFFFICIIAAFAVVSLFVWAHDTLYQDEDDEF